jgi:hypothetical protein
MSDASNHRFGLPGLCVAAALGLIAFGAPTAQAAPPEWMLGGANVAANKTVSAKATFEPFTFENGENANHETAFETASLAMLLASTTMGPIWIGCKKAESAATKPLVLEAGGVARDEAIEFTQCSTSIKQSGHMKLSAVCQPVEPITVRAKFEIVLLLGAPAVRVKGEFGGSLTTIEIPSGCAFEGSYQVTETAFLKDCEAKLETEQSQHLVVEAAGGTLKLGSISATIDGSGTLKILEGGAEKTFSVLAS